MPVFRIDKTKDYTVMSNYHLRDKMLSLKAKDLLSLMLSLSDTWDYTLQGLAHICKDGIDSVRAGITEIENVGYLTRRRLRGENGQLGDIEYTILEKPIKPENVDNSVENTPPKSEKPTSVKPTLENPIQVKPTQDKRTQSSIYSNQELKKSNTHGSNINSSIRNERASAVENPIDTIDSMESYRDFIKENISYAILVSSTNTVLTNSARFWSLCLKRFVPSEKQSASAAKMSRPKL